MGLLHLHTTNQTLGKSELKFFFFEHGNQFRLS